MVPVIRRLLISIIAFTLACWIPACAQAQMAVQQPIKPNVLTFSRGLQTNTADLLRTKDYAKILNNVQMTRRGVWTSRGIGWTPVDTIAVDGFSQPQSQDFIEIAQHFDANSVQTMFFQVGRKVYSYVVGTLTETYQGTVGNYNVPCMRSYSPTVLVYVNGFDEPKAWDGNVTFAALAGWPITVGAINYSKPSICELFVTRMVYAGFPAQPYTVVLSKAATHNTFTVAAPTVATDAGAFTLPSALGPIVGLKTLRLSNTTNDQILLVGCTRGMAFIGGTDATNFYSRELSRQHGLLSNRGWIQIQNDLWYPATDGIRSFSNLTSSATLVPDTLTFGINDLWGRVNTNYTRMIFAVHHPSTQEVWYWLPVDSDTFCQHVIILNYNTDKNIDGTTAPIFSTRDGLEGGCGTDYNGTMYIGGLFNASTNTTTGKLLNFYSGDTNNGLDILWTIMPAFIESNSQNPLQSSQSKRILILTEGGAQSFRAEAYSVSTNANDSSSRWDLVHMQRLSSGTGGSSGAFYYATWNLTQLTATYTPHIIEFDPPGTARYWAIKLSSENPLHHHIDLVGIAQLQNVGGGRQ